MDPVYFLIILPLLYLASQPAKPSTPPPEAVNLLRPETNNTLKSFATKTATIPPAILLPNIDHTVAPNSFAKIENATTSVPLTNTSQPISAKQNVTANNKQSPTTYLKFQNAPLPLASNIRPTILQQQQQQQHQQHQQHQQTHKIPSTSIVERVLIPTSPQPALKPAAHQLNTTHLETRASVKNTSTPPTTTRTTNQQQYVTQVKSSLFHSAPSLRFTDDIYDPKELIDYGDEYMEALNFVQNDRFAGRFNALKRERQILANHHNNEEMYKYLSDLATRYPEITRLYHVGESVEGQKLWVLEITEEPGKHKLLKPEFKYVANMHGNEVVGRELLLHLARLLVENYRAAQGEPIGDTKPTPAKFVKTLLKSTRIHLMPSMNPDGYARSTHVGCRFEKSRKGRLNANNVDLNSNFPHPVLGNKVDASTQPEVRAVMEWSKNVPFVLSANFHGGALVASYPYDGALSHDREYKATPDDDIFRNLANTYSKSHLSMSNGKPCYDRCHRDHHLKPFEEGITNGANWILRYGGMKDWLYENTNSLDITVHLGCNRYPEANTLPQYWLYNKRALLNYIKEAHRGVKGVISDASTGVLLPDVTVHVVNRRHNVTSTAYGDYFRLLLPGYYEILFERENYATQRVHVKVHNLMAQVVNIKLEPVVVDAKPQSPPDQVFSRVLNHHTYDAYSNSEAYYVVADDRQNELSLLGSISLIIVIAIVMIATVLIYSLQKSYSQKVATEKRPPAPSAPSSLKKTSSQIFV